MKRSHEISTVQIIRKGERANPDGLELSGQQPNSDTKDFSFVASKKGVYYYPINCSKAQALSVKNMLYFKDKVAAETAGYKAYAGCF